MRLILIDCQACSDILEALIDRGHETHDAVILVTIAVTAIFGLADAIQCVKMILAVIVSTGLGGLLGSSNAMVSYAMERFLGICGMLCSDAFDGLCFTVLCLGTC